jgi:hypothetical protein
MHDLALINANSEERVGKKREEERNGKEWKGKGKERRIGEKGREGKERKGIIDTHMVDNPHLYCKRCLSVYQLHIFHHYCTKRKRE